MKAEEFELRIPIGVIEYGALRDRYAKTSDEAVKAYSKTRDWCIHKQRPEEGQQWVVAFKANGMSVPRHCPSRALAAANELVCQKAYDDAGRPPFGKFPNGITNAFRALGAQILSAWKHPKAAK